MSENICLPRSHFFSIIAVFLALTWYHNINTINKMYKTESTFYDKDFDNGEINKIKVRKNKARKNKVLKNKVRKNKLRSISDEDIKLSTKIRTFDFRDSDKIIRNFLKKRDRSAYMNDMVAPERRIAKDSYPIPIKNYINIPTRGDPDNYHQIGNLIRGSDEKVVKLFGRQKYPRSNQWEYYIVSRDPNGLDTKLPIKIKGDREVEDSSLIDIPFYNSSKGKFKVQLLDFDKPRYNPYVY